MNTANNESTQATLDNIIQPLDCASISFERMFESKYTTKEFSAILAEVDVFTVEHSSFQRICDILISNGIQMNCYKLGIEEQKTLLSRVKEHESIIFRYDLRSIFRKSNISSFVQGSGFYPHYGFYKKVHDKKRGLVVEFSDTKVQVAPYESLFFDNKDKLEIFAFDINSIYNFYTRRVSNLELELNSLISNSSHHINCCEEYLTTLVEKINTSVEFTELGNIIKTLVRVASKKHWLAIYLEETNRPTKYIRQTSKYYQNLAKRISVIDRDGVSILAAMVNSQIPKLLQVEKTSINQLESEYITMENQ